jgi:cell division protein FtsI (penicillin-binding protein 3)
MKGTIRLHRWVRARILGVAGLLTLLLAAIAYRAYGLQIREADHYRLLAERQHIATVEVPAPRGALYDATGAELAVSADIDSIYVNPHEVDDLLGTAEKLGALCTLDPGELEARLASPRHFVWIKRHVGAAEAAAVKAAGLPGVYLTPEPRRFYPGRRLAGPVIGFAGIDGRGLDGIELTMDEELAGKLTSASAVRDASGDLMLPDVGARPRPGAAVTLTLHRYVQMAAERALDKAITDEKARAGVVVVLDVKSGDVLALASWPTYDPNRPGGAREEGARNRAVTDVYEIGSIMKVFTIAAALDAGAVTPDTWFDVEGGRLQVGRKTIKDTYHDDKLSVGGVLKRSSNVGAVKIARRLGRERLHEALLRFGFGARSGIELPGEETGLVRPPTRWGEIGLATHAFGYGLSVTPIQVAAAFAAVANGGVYQPPRLVREVRGESGKVLYQRMPEGRRILSETSARALAPMMASVFDRGKEAGTAHSLTLDGFRAGGKTGTAHKIDPATGRYGDHLYLSSFAGFAPLEDPRVAVLVLIDEPHGEHHYGGQVAGPVWVDVMTATLRYLGVPTEKGTEPADKAPDKAPDREKEPAASAAAMDEGAPLAEDEVAQSGPGGMPDFTGLGVAEALEVAKEQGIRVEVEGSGRAIRQFPPPGAPSKAAECRIVFAHESADPTRSSP